jgi:hypothetical protein
MTKPASRTPSPERLQELVDKQDIFDCIVRLNRGADRADRDLFLSAFHPDAIADVGYFVGGRDALWEVSTQLGVNAASEHHYVLNQTCDVDGDTAHAETYFLYVQKTLAGEAWAAGGRYIDRFEWREDGGWRIIFRYNNIEWFGGLNAGAELFTDIADIHANGVPSRSKDDPSYRRPLVNRRKLTEPAA